MTKTVVPAAALGICLLFSGLFLSDAPATARSSGLASWYGQEHHGRKTASGERFNQHAMTAAHRTLPFGTRVRVTNRANGRSAVVRINDRGPYHGNRIIDLSRKAAKTIGMLAAGTARIKMEVL